MSNYTQTMRRKPLVLFVRESDFTVKYIFFIPSFCKELY